MQRKGFPESYDQRRLLRFLADVKAGVPSVCGPYSHLHYDIVPGAQQCVEQPDILILEGIERAAIAGRRARLLQLFVSDFFDFSIYLDAEEATIERWYIERFLRLCETVFQNKESYFHRYAGLSGEEARATAREF